MEREDKRSVWLFRPRPNAQARIRLFCFPCAGKGASLFRKWGHFLPDWVEVCGVQCPGREQRLREAPFARLPRLVDAAAWALRPFVDRPYVIFGHSVGALVGFEWARQLRRLGCLDPLHLVVAARRAPHRREQREPIAHLPQADFIDAVRRRYDGIPAEILQDPDLLDLLVPTLRADLQLLENYVYEHEAPLASPITCFWGREDAETDWDDLEGWRQHSAANFNVQMFPGGHFFVQSAETELVGAVAGIVCGAVNGRVSGAEQA